MLKEYKIDTSKEMGSTISGDLSRKLNKEENLAVLLLSFETIKLAEIIEKITEQM